MRKKDPNWVYRSHGTSGTFPVIAKVFLNQKTSTQTAQGIMEPPNDILHLQRMGETEELEPPGGW